MKRFRWAIVALVGAALVGTAASASAVSTAPIADWPEATTWTVPAVLPNPPRAEQPALEPTWHRPNSTWPTIGAPDPACTDVVGDRYTVSAPWRNTAAVTMQFVLWDHCRQRAVRAPVVLTRYSPGVVFARNVYYYTAPSVAARETVTAMVAADTDAICITWRLGRDAGGDVYGSHGACFRITWTGSGAAAVTPIPVNDPAVWRRLDRWRTEPWPGRPVCGNCM